jgi:uncharacterized repeat protein (TIGR03803 family)
MKCANPYPAKIIASIWLASVAPLVALLVDCGGDRSMSNSSAAVAPDAATVKGNSSASAASDVATVTTLHLFSGADGWAPVAGLVADGDGEFIGTTTGGDGNSGTVFEITANGAFSTLCSFSGPDGYAPLSIVRGTDGNFYGTTTSGGAYGAGTVFRVTHSGALTTLHSFSGPDGYGPLALVQANDGNFYGTTAAGGTTYVNSTTYAATGAGTVFKITASGALTTLYSFTGTDGYEPAVIALSTDGNLYGTTTFGEPAYVSTATNVQGSGTIFRITPSGALTTLYAFSGPSNYQPTALVQGSDGNFYGTTYLGGVSAGDSSSMVFKMTPSGDLTALYSFSGPDGLNAMSLIQGSDGNFYGTTAEGGSAFRSGGMSVGFGTVFRITPSGALTTLYAFDGTDGDLPHGQLVEGISGTFFGVTASGGGDGGGGTVFEFVSGS